jgi:hypothetical protein
VLFSQEKALKRLIPLILLACCGFTLAQTPGTVVVIDISGTMKGYGHWQPDALGVCQAILQRGSLESAKSSWDIKGNESAVKSFAVGEGQVTVIPFGSTKTNFFPYFTGIKRLGSSSELGSAFPLDRELFREARTNKPLALAVAAKLVGAEEVTRAIVISDFMVDSQLTKDEESFVNDFESSTLIETPIILSWRQDPKVQIKLIAFHKTEPAEGSATNGAFIEILPPKLRNSSPRSLELKWRTSDGARPKFYNVDVNDRETGKLLMACPISCTSGRVSVAQRA